MPSRLFDQLKRFHGGEDTLSTTIAGHRFAIGPIDMFGARLLRNQPRQRLASPRDDNFLSRRDPAKESGIVVSEISNGGRFHCATYLERSFRMSSSCHPLKNPRVRLDPFSNIEPVFRVPAGGD